MLKYVNIINYALIENCELEFQRGFNVITGESGAGKSILTGAVEFLLGGRSDRSVIRKGAARCVVSGTFEVPPGLSAAVSALLDEAGVPFDTGSGWLDLRRVLTASGVRSFINDVPVGAKLLADTGRLLIDHHGAGDQLSLLVSGRQLAVLDRYAGLEADREKCAALCAQLSALRRERAGFDSGLPDQSEASRLELMLEEIDRINPEANEDETLAARHRLGSNSRQVLESARELTSLLTESENSVADQLGSVYRGLTAISRIDDTLTGGLLDEVGALQDSVAQLSAGIENLAAKVDLDPDELHTIEARLSEIYTLKRRYGPTLEQLFAAREAAVSRLANFRAAAEKRQDFDRMETALAEKLENAARELSRRRQKAAGNFLSAVRAKLETVGFPGCRLEAQFTAAETGPAGMDKLELLFSANAGEEPRPLRRVASSGELSRVMLALKTVLADADDTATVIFDEIDMNIGGETANRVGEELHSLGQKRQIICISHLPQVAARADAHYLAFKETLGERTFSQVIRLESAEKELARMLGGGTAALAHARELCRMAKL